jgi:superoxide dismutase, Cu-Zn family
MNKPTFPAGRRSILMSITVVVVVLGACTKEVEESLTRTLAGQASLALDTVHAPRIVDAFPTMENVQDNRARIIASFQPKPSDTFIQGARAELHALNGSGVSGVIEFAQDGEHVVVIGKVSGLPPGKHGFHVHENGNCSAPDGSSAGDHFAPFDGPHGAPEAPAGLRHVGDLGNVEAGEDGTADISITDTVIRLEGAASIVGRAIILHAKADDLSSQPAGNAGDRVACGVIREMIEAAPPPPIANGKQRGLICARF